MRPVRWMLLLGGFCVRYGTFCSYLINYDKTQLVLFFPNMYPHFKFTLSTLSLNFQKSSINTQKFFEIPLFMLFYFVAFMAFAIMQSANTITAKDFYIFLSLIGSYYSSTLFSTHSFEFEFPSTLITV